MMLVRVIVSSPKLLLMAAAMILIILSLSVTKVSACPVGTLTIRPGAVITAEGDSLTYGFDSTETGNGPPINGSRLARSSMPFPERLESGLDGLVKVINHGYPGDRSKEGLERWRYSDTTDVTLLMFGTNDLGNFGNHPGGSLTPDAFERNIYALATRRLERGGAVVLLAPPPLEDLAADQRLESYRKVTRKVADELKILYIDIPAKLQKLDGKWTDRLHLSVDSNAAIAEAISAVLCFQDR